MKCVESEDGYITVCPVYELINNEKNKVKKEELIEDNLKIYNRFLEKNVKEISNKIEYTI